ncbi:MAG: exodeoxyribonuclease III [Propionibacteriaceae bacterium]|jgi:exodeoxyribonuclease-3|nr:exodeoxyribonuclease III [Propionibacteriaceae bacterium]
MLIGTFNVNGIRACAKRGFGQWLPASGLDILAIQEMRCKPEDLPDVFGGYHLTYFPGDVPGRNGVALVSKDEPEQVREGFGYTEDHEGRYLEADFPGLTVASLYLPKGGVLDDSEGEAEKYRKKMDFIAAFRPYLDKACKTAQDNGKEFLVMGDFNIAHENQDLKNWKTNQKSSGFLPEERRWFDEVLAPGTLFDVVRRLNPDALGPYSWWSWRGKAFDNNAGWRIDYQLATAGLASRAVSDKVERAEDYASRLSDHAAVVVEYS